FDCRKRPAQYVSANGRPQFLLRQCQKSARGAEKAPVATSTTIAVNLLDNCFVEYLRWSCFRAEKLAAHLDSEKLTSRKAFLRFLSKRTCQRCRHALRKLRQEHLRRRRLFAALLLQNVVNVPAREDPLTRQHLEYNQGQRILIGPAVARKVGCLFRRGIN